MQRMLRQWSVRIFALFIVGQSATVTVQAQRITWLGRMDAYSSIPRDVSDDGSVVVGDVQYSTGRYRAFRWTEQTGMQNLGTLTIIGRDSIAYGVSADGTVIVGVSEIAPLNYRAFRWTAETGMQNLGSLSASGFSSAHSVSADGSVVVGMSDYRAFRWTAQTGLQDLGVPSGWEYASLGAEDVSADGSVVVGFLHSGTEKPFRWTNQTGMQVVPIPDRGRAEAVSPDGSVVVGWMVVLEYIDQWGEWESYARAFRWSEHTGLQEIGTPSGFLRSWAEDVSAHGAVVVGYVGGNGADDRAVRWTARTGMQDLNLVYADLLSDGSRLMYATAVSANGRYIVGYGSNASAGSFWEAFLLDTGESVDCSSSNGDVNADQCVDDGDLLQVMFSFGFTGQNPADVNCDGTVDDADLLIVLFNFGEGC